MSYPQYYVRRFKFISSVMMNGFLQKSLNRLWMGSIKCYLGKLIVLQFFLWGVFTSHLTAVTAYPHPFEFTQPDGTIVTIRMMGDEKVHWAETMDYYSLLANSQGGWEYAILDGKGDMVPSGVLAANPENRSILARNLLFSVPKSLRFSSGQVQILHSFWNQNKSGEKAFVPTGNKSLVMILVAYTDRAFTRTQAEFNNLMNQIGYNLGGAQGSVKDFFLENSYNTFNVTTTVVGPYTLSNTMAYYGANVAGNDVRPREMVTEAVILADAAVNYANFDNDGDGTVDGVYVIYAGFGEEAGGGANCIWAHAWAIPTINRDGVNINRYSCSAELRGNSGTNISTIGVICHEFGHVCGAPDYYDTDYATGGQYDGTGSWDLMAGGSWNGINAAGDCPAHANGYQKWLYGWAHPTLLSVQQAVSMQSSALHDEFYYYTTPTANEFFYCENRQLVGFDRGIPGHGMIIYHVDQPYIAGAGNAINAGSHQGMYPVCANAAGNPTAVYGVINGGGCPFPGTGARTSFTDATTPHSHSWAGANTAKPLTNIVENAGVVSFCFISCAPGDPINFTATAASSTQINLSWTLNSNSDPVMVAVSADAAFGTPVNGTSYSPGAAIPGGDIVIYNGTATSFNHTSLSPNTTYYYKAWSVMPGTVYSSGVEANATTWCAAISSFPYNQGFENAGNIPSCWSQQVVAGGIYWNFRAGSGSGSPATARTGSYNANFFEGAYGTVNVSKLISPAFNISALTTPQLSFWYFNRLWTPDQDVLRLYYKTSAAGAWTLLATYNTNVSAWTEVTINLPNKSAEYYFSFEGTENYGYGICIDDVILQDGASLPVELTNFSANCSDYGYDVSWTTVSETNSDYFILEKSNDAIRFIPVGVISAAGNSNHSLLYSVEVPGTENCYFRLKQVDINGNTHIYPPLRAECKPSTNPQIIVFPVPAEDFCTLRLAEIDERVKIEIISNVGQIYTLSQMIDVSQQNELTFSVVNFASGIYVVKVTELDSGNTFSTKMVIN